MTEVEEQFVPIAAAGVASLLAPIPSPVPFQDATALEWQPLLTLVGGYAISRVGREAILSLTPLD